MIRGIDFLLNICFNRKSNNNQGVVMENSLYRDGGLSPREQWQRSSWAIVIAGVAVVLGVLVGGMASYLDSPRVYVSNSTGKCVRVVSPEGERPCAPGDEKKYERVWVK